MKNTIILQIAFIFVRYNFTSFFFCFTFLISTKRITRLCGKQVLVCEPAVVENKIVSQAVYFSKLNLYDGVCMRNSILLTKPVEEICNNGNT